MRKLTKKKKPKTESALHAVRKEPKRLNAFEMHVNRRKFDVLGMKRKAERGLPGVSRSRSIKKRKATLLQDYKQKDKSNTFLDRRIGERDSAMTVEDKIMARFTAERMRMHSKKSIFNLGDGEELTHRGEILTEIEKYDDPKSDDEFDDEEGDKGKLGADFVGEAHFGGGIFKKVEGETKSRKEFIDQLIAESKKRKAEKQKLREETIDLTQKLDSEWKDLLPLVTSTKRSETSPDRETNKKDVKTASYDMLTKQLKFEARGKPSDKLKSEEEIAKLESEKLQAMEKERLDKMLGETKKAAIKHRSADDLDDGFEEDDGADFTVSYDDKGILAVPGDLKEAATGKGENESEGGEEEETEEEEEEDEEDEEEEGEGDENDSVDISELKESDESDADEEEEEVAETSTTMGKTTKEPSSKSTADELPYTFDIPREYEEFESLISAAEPAAQATIIERMIKCNHPSLKDANKDKLDVLFTFLLQHLEDSSSSSSSSDVNCFRVLESLSPFMYDLVQWNPESASAAVVAVVREKYGEFLRKRRKFPGLSTLLFFKLVGLLFSTSDYRNKVVTPTYVFMEHVLSSCRVTSSVDASAGLFVATLLLEYSSFSKRYVPELFNFVRGILRLAQPKDSSLPVSRPFTLRDMDRFDLIVGDRTRSYAADKLRATDLSRRDDSDEFKVKCLNLSLEILSQLVDSASEEPFAALLLEDFVPLLEAESHCVAVREAVDGIRRRILAVMERPLRRLTLGTKRPKALKLYEPRIEEVYALKKHQPMGKKKQERAKLRHKYKKEVKGALREIRRDNSFLAKLKFRDVRKSDLERRRKVREILGSVAEQTGEAKKMKRKKR